MSGKKKRLLSAEEKALWERAVEKTLPHAKRADMDLPTLAPKAVELTKTEPILPFEIGSMDKTGPFGASRNTFSETASVNMDRKTFQKMSKGRLRPEAKLDLHGLTLADAHPVLTRYLLSAQNSGKRLVLVVTGKGKERRDDGPIPVRRGALRHQIPLWLAQAPLAQIVLQVSEAHGKHGGGGAFYVYLRRRR